MLSTDLSRFDHNATSYSPSNALILAEASKLAYKPEATIKQVLENTGKTPNVKYISDILPHQIKDYGVGFLSSRIGIPDYSLTGFRL